MGYRAKHLNAEYGINTLGGDAIFAKLFSIFSSARDNRIHIIKLGFLNTVPKLFVKINIGLNPVDLRHFGQVVSGQLIAAAWSKFKYRPGGLPNQGRKICLKLELCNLGALDYFVIISLAISTRPNKVTLIATNLPIASHTLLNTRPLIFE